MCSPRRANPAAALARQAILDHQLSGEGKEERNDRYRHRPANAVRSNDESDAGVRASLDVDSVVADAKSRNDREPPVGMDAVLGETVRQKDERVKIGELLRSNGIAGLQIGELDPRSATKRFEIEVGVNGRAISLAEIARKGDAKRLAHAVFSVLPRFALAGAHPSRSLPIASASASCSTHTSPE